MTDTAVEEAEPQKDEKLAEKHGFIDLDKIENDDVRQQVQDRLSGLYRSYKESDAALDEMRRLYSNMEKEVATLKASKEKDQTDARLAEVRKGLADAHAKGDFEKAAQYQEQLVDLKAPKPAPVKDEQSDELTPAEKNALFAWQAEMTDDGRIKRPWANPGHPKYRETIATLVEASQNPKIAAQGFDAILDEVHQRLAPKPKQASPVADGDATPTRQTGKEVRLTPQQERVARKMYPNEKDPIAAYTKALKQYGDQ